MVEPVRGPDTTLSTLQSAQDRLPDVVREIQLQQEIASREAARGSVNSPVSTPTEFDTATTTNRQPQETASNVPQQAVQRQTEFETTRDQPLPRSRQDLLGLSTRDALELFNNQVEPDVEPTGDRTAGVTAVLTETVPKAPERTEEEDSFNVVEAAQEASEGRARNIVEALQETQEDQQLTREALEDNSGVLPAKAGSIIDIAV